jgi:hypothetical protein
MAGDFDQLFADHRGGGDFGLESVFEARVRGGDDLTVRLTQGLRADEGRAVLDALQAEDVGGETLGLDLASSTQR